MAPATAPLIVAAALLVLAGAPKVLRPRNTVGALRSVGVRVPAALVRLGGAAEAALGATVLLSGGRIPAALVAVSYLSFTAFLAVALRRGGTLASCGCLGRADTPPTVAHLVITVGLCAGACVAAATSADALPDLTLSAASLTLLVFVSLALWLVWVGFTVLPRARLPIQEG
jgi:hypothetical protein